MARDAAIVRDRHKCIKCSAKYPLEVNHIEPRRSRGYQSGCHNHLTNLETLCRSCHVEITKAQRRTRPEEPRRRFWAWEWHRRDIDPERFWKWHKRLKINTTVYASLAAAMADTANVHKLASRGVCPDLVDVYAPIMLRESEVAVDPHGTDMYRSLVGGRVFEMRWGRPEDFALIELTEAS